MFTILSVQQTTPNGPPQAEPVELSETASRGLSVIANPHEPGLLRVVVYGTIPLDDNGVLLNLRFNPVGSSGAVSPLTWERFMFNEGEPGVSVLNGRVVLAGRSKDSESYE